MKFQLFCAIALSSMIIASCQPSSSSANAEKAELQDSAENADDGMPFSVAAIADFTEPWAMAFIPDTPFALITEKRGRLKLWNKEGDIIDVKGAPEVDYGGQGGLGDIVLAPDFAKNRMVYLSWAEAGDGSTRGAAVGRARLNMAADGGPALEGMEIIWRQYPKVSGRGHYGHRLAFSPDGKYLFIASGERQKFDPAQDMDSNMGKVLRLYPDGSIPGDNPFFTPGNDVRSQIWSLGHRNPLGLTFDSAGNLWNSEMGPAGGDEINLVTAGVNYGYPEVSNGDHYDGTDIPDHSDGDGYSAPKAWWNPAISPGGLLYYTGDLFQERKGSLFLGGLGAQALVRVKVNGTELKKAEQWGMGSRIREVEQGPNGAIWLLTDGRDGKLLKLTPKE